MDDDNEPAEENVPNEGGQANQNNQQWGGVVYAIDGLLDIQTHDQAFVVSNLILFSL